MCNKFHIIVNCYVSTIIYLSRVNHTAFVTIFFALFMHLFPLSFASPCHPWPGPSMNRICFFDVNYAHLYGTLGFA